MDDDIYDSPLLLDQICRRLITMHDDLVNSSNYLDEDTNTWLSKTHSREHTLALSVLRLATLILTNPEMASCMSDEDAAACFTSLTAVARYVADIGLASYEEVAAALKELTMEQLGSVLATDDDEILLN